MRHFAFRWIVTTFAVFVAAPIVGISYGDRLGCLLGASLLLGIVNAFIRPILLLLSLPLILVTLGVFILIINALMLKVVGAIVPCFEVPGFWSAFFGAIIISIVSWLLSAFFRGSDGRVHVLTHHTQVRRVQARVIEPDEGGRR
jgi:putative membrane protein